MYQIKEAIQLLRTTAPTFYKHKDKLKINLIKKEGNTTYITKEDFDRLADIIEKNRGGVFSQENTIQNREDNKSVELNKNNNEIGEIIETNNQLKKRNEVLENQIKVYGEAIMDYKTENRDLKTKVEKTEIELKEERIKYNNEKEELTKNIITTTIKADRYKLIWFFLLILILIIILWQTMWFIKL